jgi:hypothetical protein
MQKTALLKNWARGLVMGSILASLFAAAQSVQAQQANETLAYRTPLGSINFITNEGQIVSYSAFTGEGSGSDHFNDLGVQTSKSRTTTYSWGQTLGYGLTNDIEIIFKDSYSTASSHYTPFGGVGSSTDSSGFADPSFSLLWRALNQGPGYPVSLDLTVAYAPDLLDARSASSTYDGTIARGGSTFTGTAALSHASGGNIYYASFAATDSFERSIMNQPLSGPYYQKASDYWQYVFNVAYQHYFDERFSASIGFQFYSSDAYQVANDGGNNLTYTKNEGPSYRPNVSLNYAFVPDQVVGSLGYTHIIESKVDNTVLSDPTKSSSTRDGQSDVVTGTLRILFR